MEGGGEKGARNSETISSEMYMAVATLARKYLDDHNSGSAKQTNINFFAHGGIQCFTAKIDYRANYQVDLIGYLRFQ